MAGMAVTGTRRATLAGGEERARPNAVIMTASVGIYWDAIVTLI